MYQFVVLIHPRFFMTERGEYSRGMREIRPVTICGGALSVWPMSSCWIWVP